MRTNHDHSIKAVGWGLTSQSRICPRGLGYLLRSPFGCISCETNWVVLKCVLKPTTKCVDFGDLKRVSSVGQGELLPVTCPRLPGRSYRATPGC